MANTFIDKVGGGNTPVDFAALAENSWKGAMLGLSGQEIAAQNDAIAGLSSPDRVRY